VLPGLVEALVHSAVNDEQYLAAVSASIRMAATTRPATSWDAGGARAGPREHRAGKPAYPPERTSRHVVQLAESLGAHDHRLRQATGVGLTDS
jgi:hypothetical protein